jgi:hypothetical protein
MGFLKPAHQKPFDVSCRCGERLSIDPSSVGKTRVCPECRRTITLNWKNEGKKRSPWPVVTFGPARIERSPGQRSPYTAFCGCGYSRPVPPAEAGATPPCPGCGKLMVVEKAPDPKEIREQAQAKRPRTAAPPVPLRLRPPAPVRVKHDAQFFECPCGERVVIGTGTPGTPVQCPNCERHHRVERLAAPPPPAPSAGKTSGRKAPPPPSGAEARTPPRPSRPLQLGEFLCKCGAIQPPRTSRTGKAFTCASCGRSGRIEMVVDPVTQESVFRVYITSGPA